MRGMRQNVWNSTLSVPVSSSSRVDLPRGAGAESRTTHAFKLGIDEADHWASPNRSSRAAAVTGSQRPARLSTALTWRSAAEVSVARHSTKGCGPLKPGAQRVHEGKLAAWQLHMRRTRHEALQAGRSCGSKSAESHLTKKLTALEPAKKKTIPLTMYPMVSQKLRVHRHAVPEINDLVVVAKTPPPR